MDFDLSDYDIEVLRKKLDNLTIQSMIFDMDIDYETLSLTEKRKDEQPLWLKKWQEKRAQADNDPASPEQAWA